MYKVTVITVVYNAESSIEKSILSVKRQSQRGVQHLLIDGMSTDKTLDIIKQHSHQDMIVISEKDNGIYDAMNKGLALAIMRCVPPSFPVFVIIISVLETLEKGCPPPGQVTSKSNLS